MRDDIAAKRYAEGFLAYLKETIGHEKGVTELQNVRQNLLDNPSLQKFLTNWQVTTQEKFDAIDAIFTKNASLETRQFLKLLVEKKRIARIIEIIDYTKEIYSQGKEINAVVKTTHPLDNELIRSLIDKLTKKLRTKVNLTVELAPELIGGAEIIIGNTQIDGSIKRGLSDLKEQLLAIRVS